VEEDERARVGTRVSRARGLVGLLSPSGGLTQR